MHYGHLGRRYVKDGTVYTPTKISSFLFNLLSPVLNPRVVLDPCVGTGRLLEPWHKSSYTIGVDLQNQGVLWTDNFIQYPFDQFTTWSFETPDLILCNPPYCQSERQMMWPERFLRTLHALFKGVPTVLFVPHGFRFNVREHSRRRQWLMSDGPKISSIISLPLDAFPTVQLHVEILIFNINGLDPHYWINYVQNHCD